MAFGKKGIFFVLSLWFLITTPALGWGAGFSLEEQARRVNVPIFNLAGEDWISLPDLATLFQGVFKEDPVSRRMEIRFAGHSLVCLLGSRKAFFDDRLQEMSQPVRLIAGVSAVPFSFASLVAKMAFLSNPTPPAFYPVPTDATPPKEEGPVPPLPASVAEILAEAVNLESEGITIVLDAGHGGKDPGATGPYGLEEKDVNLDLVLHLADFLKRSNPSLQVVLTRKDDSFLSLPERVQIANSLPADLFVSVHTNDAKYNRHTADGFETFYSPVKPERVASAQASVGITSPLTGNDATLVVAKSQYLASLIQGKLAERLNTPDRGIKRGSFYVVRETFMPAVLVEVGFIGNPNIEANLRQREVRQAIAEAIGRGVLAYLEGQPLKGSMRVDTSTIAEPVDE